MATIKDVAKLAGVSLGTVSNVLNGKTNNEELIEKVEKAVRKLSYRPDAMARSLKNTNSSLIGLVLPNAVEPQYHEFMMTLEKHLRSRGYDLLIHFSHGNRLVEKQAVESFLDKKVSAVIIYSGMALDFQDEWADNKTPMLLLTNDTRVSFHGSIFYLDYAEAFQKTLNLLRTNKKAHVGLVVERDIYEAGRFREIFQSYFPDESLVVLADSIKEAGFRAAFELNYACDSIDAIIVGSQALGEGLLRGLALLHKEKIPIYAVKASSWVEDANRYAGEISVSHHDVAIEAMHDVLDSIEKPLLHEQVTRTVSAELKVNTLTPHVILPGENELHFAMYDCSSARSLQIYSMIYERESGQKLHFDMYPYAELEALLYEQADRKDSFYDGFMIDIAWFQGLTESGLVRNLDHILQNKAYLSGFTENAIRDYGMYVESLFAIPFMSGSQILFYQRDLFGNRTLRRKFERKYNAPLAPPTTWMQFNAVAEFFTRRFNPDSPVKYGVSMTNGDNVYLAIDFLDRLWAYGGKVFDDFGNVTVNSSHALAALNSLVQSFLYASGERLDSWDKVAREFAEGNSAMVILYSSDAGEINDPTRSRVAGNLGYSLIPGGVSVQGGWSLGLNRYGKHAEEAERFIMWACDKYNGIPLTLMGGSTLRKEYYQSQDLERVQPWKKLVEQTFQTSRKRAMPEILDDSRWKNTIYTEIIPGEILRVLHKEIDGQTALANMAQRIERLIQK